MIANERISQRSAAEILDAISYNNDRLRYALDSIRLLFTEGEDRWHLEAEISAILHHLEENPSERLPYDV